MVTEKIDDNDQTDIGSPWPKLHYGFNVNLGYKAFDLSIFFQGVLRERYLLYGMWRHLNFVGSGQEYEYIYQDAWNGPRIYQFKSNTDDCRSERQFQGHHPTLLKMAHTCVLKTFSLVTNIPKKLCNKMMISNGPNMGGCTNLLTFTRYRGIDPEAGANGSPLIEAGYDWNKLFPAEQGIYSRILLVIF